MNDKATQQMKEELSSLMGTIFNDALAESMSNQFEGDFTYDNGKKISKEEYVEKLKECFAIYNKMPNYLSDSNTRRVVEGGYKDVIKLENEFIPLVKKFMDPISLEKIRRIYQLSIEQLKDQIDKDNEVKDPEAQPA